MKARYRLPILCLLLLGASLFAEDLDPFRGENPVLRLDVSAKAGTAPSYNDERSLLFAPCLGADLGGEIAWGYLVPLRAELGIFSVMESGHDAYLFSYRPFWGLRGAAEIGLRLPISAMEIELLGGAAVSASAGTGTSNVTTYLSALAEIRAILPLDLAILPESRLAIGLPLEYMWRGSTTSYLANLRISLVLPLGKGGEK